jgi:hypothetical protein
VQYNKVANVDDQGNGITRAADPVKYKENVRFWDPASDPDVVQPAVR